MSKAAELDFAESVLREFYRIEGKLTPLVGYDDRNYEVHTRGGDRYVLKLSDDERSGESIRFQHALLDHLARTRCGLDLPFVVQARNGRSCLSVLDPGDRIRLVRLHHWVAGRYLADIVPGPEIFGSLGKALARLDRALLDFAHPGMRRSLDWDLLQALSLLEAAEQVFPESRRFLVLQTFERFATRVLPNMDKLRRSVIHNDGNEHNVLLSARSGPSLEVSGLIDFGDSVYTATVCEPAIAAAYALILPAGGPQAAVSIVRGYHEGFPLYVEELSLLVDLMRMRLCVSVVQSARKRTEVNFSAYNTISEAGAWGALEGFAEEDWRRLSEDMFHRCTAA